MLNSNKMLLKLEAGIILFFLMISGAGVAQTPAFNSKTVKDTTNSTLYRIDGVPYLIKYAKQSNCNFTERELALLQKTFQALPEAYSSIRNEFYFEKKCILDINKNSEDEKDLLNSRAHVASSSLGKITLTDQTFSYVRDGKLSQLSERFSKKMITHELTHQLDRQFNYSDNDQFRQINSWHRSFGFMTFDKEKAEGFQHDQGSDSPTEDLATQSEGFYFDTDYLCKHPQAYVWFYYWIGPSKVTASECPSEMNSPIDPNKVKDVGYILISPTSDNAESNFGHAILHFRMNQADPFEDFVIEAAGNVTGMPTLTGFETPAELIKKQEDSEKLKVSRLGFLMRGASGNLDLKIQLMKYKLKWLETVIYEGRDISERILALTKLQTRVLVYLINKDLKGLNDNYNVLTKNCASYVARMINQAIGDEVAVTNSFGLHTPKNVYKTIAPVVEKDLPVTEGNRTHLARLLPKREKAIADLKKESAFATVNFKDLESVEESQKTVGALNKLFLLSKQNSSQLSPEMKKTIQVLVYSYTFENRLSLQNKALEVYQGLFREFKEK